MPLIHRIYPVFITHGDQHRHLSFAYICRRHIPGSLKDDDLQVGSSLQSHPHSIKPPALAQTKRCSTNTQSHSSSHSSVDYPWKMPPAKNNISTHAILGQESSKSHHLKRSAGRESPSAPVKVWQRAREASWSVDGLVGLSPPSLACAPSATVAGCRIGCGQSKSISPTCLGVELPSSKANGV